MSPTPQSEDDHSARLAVVETRLSTVEGTLGLFRRESDDMKKTINETAAKVDEIGRDTKEIVFYWSEARSAFRLFNRLAWLMRGFIKFVVLPMAVLLAALYAWTHGGQAPSWLTQLLKVIE